MSQSYVKECIFCKAKIRMSDQKERKWLPYNQDGSVHNCKSKSKQKNGNGNNDLSVEFLLKRLESIGIIIGLEKQEYEMTDKKITHFQSCGEWLEGNSSVCGECGEISK